MPIKFDQHHMILITQIPASLARKFAGSSKSFVSRSIHMLTNSRESTHYQHFVDDCNYFIDLEHSEGGKERRVVTLGN